MLKNIFIKDKTDISESPIIIDKREQKALKNLTNTQTNQTTSQSDTIEQASQVINTQSDKVKNKKRVIKKNIISSLRDKQIDSTDEIEKSKLEIEIEQYLTHSLIINQSVQKEIEVFGSIFFFKETRNCFLY